MRRFRSCSALCFVVVLAGVAAAGVAAAQPAVGGAATRLVVFEDFTRFT